MCELALDQPELRAALVAEFEVVPVATAGDASTGVEVRAVEPNTVSFNLQPSTFRLKKVGEFIRGKSPGWLIKHHWPAQSFILEIGESGAGKTFSVLDKCAAICRGVAEWRGHRVKRGKVVYVAAEGSGGFRKRVRAYEMAMGVELDEYDFRVLDAAPNLYSSAADQQGLIAAIEEAGGADLIVLDTVAATSPGANENTSDMLNVLNFYTRMINKFSATVVGIHHLGKDVTRGARGFSGIKAAADAEITTENVGGVRTVYTSKMKDGAEGEKYHFKLKVIDVDTDSDGDVITSCVVDYEDVTPVSTERRPSTDGKKRVFELLLDLGARVEPVLLEDLVATMQTKYTGSFTKPNRVLAVVDALIGEGFVTKTVDRHNKVRVGLYGGVVVDEGDEDE
jgi:hypothetical protein